MLEQIQTSTEDYEEMVNELKETLDEGNPLSPEKLNTYAEVIEEDPRLLDEPSIDITLPSITYRERYREAKESFYDAKRRALRVSAINFLESRIDEMERSRGSSEASLLTIGIRISRTMHLQSLRETLKLLSE